MKKILNFLLVIAAVFSFSFTAIAETTIKTDKFAPINITQTKASPVAVVAVASPGDFIGVKSDFLDALSGDKSINTGNTGAIQFTNNQISNAKNENAVSHVELSPPNSYRTNIEKMIIGKPDKRLSGRPIAVGDNWRFIKLE